MRIAVVSTQNNGKTTLVNTFRQLWPSYSTPTRTYRDIIKEQNLEINQNSSQESQRVIRDSLVDQAIENAVIERNIQDRCILDNIVYSFWLAEKDKINDADFLADSINICRETLKMYDIIFWLPLNLDIPIEEGKSDRDTSEDFRIEIDNIFAGIYDSYKANDGILFDKENQPCMIPLYGNLDEKIAMIQLYLDPEGELIVSESSVFDDMTSAFEQENFLAEVKKGQ